MAGAATLLLREWRIEGAHYDAIRVPVSVRLVRRGAGQAEPRLGRGDLMVGWSVVRQQRGGCGKFPVYRTIDISWPLLLL
jgi:hypothetical protein